MGSLLTSLKAVWVGQLEPDLYVYEIATYIYEIQLTNKTINTLRSHIISGEKTFHVALKMLLFHLLHARECLSLQNGSKITCR